MFSKIIYLLACIVLLLLYCSDFANAGRIKRAQKTVYTKEMLTAAERLVQNATEEERVRLYKTSTQVPGMYKVKESSAAAAMETGKLDKNAKNGTDTVGSGGGHIVNVGKVSNAEHGINVNGTIAAVATHAGAIKQAAITSSNEKAAAVAPKLNSAKLREHHVHGGEEAHVHGNRNHQTKRHQKLLSGGHYLSAKNAEKHLRLRSHGKRLKHAKYVPRNEENSDDIVGGGVGGGDEDVVQRRTGYYMEAERNSNSNGDELPTFLQRLPFAEEAGGVVMLPHNAVIETCVREIPFETLDHAGGTLGGGIEISSNVIDGGNRAMSTFSEVPDFPLLNLLKFTHMLIGKIDDQLRQLPKEDAENVYAMEAKPKLLGFLQNVHDSGFRPKEDWEPLHGAASVPSIVVSDILHDDDEEELEIRCPVHHHAGINGESDGDVVDYCTCHLIKK